MTEQQAMRMALEALEEIALPKNAKPIFREAITALRQALEQPDNEPVAMNWSVFNTGAEVWDKLSLADAVVELTPARLDRGWSAVCVIDKDNPPLYTRPQPAAWVGLTDEEISELIRATHNTGSFVRAIEAALKSKNT